MGRSVDLRSTDGRSFIDRRGKNACRLNVLDRWIGLLYSENTEAA
jgi:hypothetical protein